MADQPAWITGDCPPDTVPVARCCHRYFNLDTRPFHYRDTHNEGDPNSSGDKHSNKHFNCDSEECFDTYKFTLTVRSRGESKRL